MTVSQTINQIQGNDYDVEVTINGVPGGHFPAMTENSFQAGSTTRELTVQIMQLEQSLGGTMNTNSGMYPRQGGEASVRVTVIQNGSQVATNTTSY